MNRLVFFVALGAFVMFSFLSSKAADQQGSAHDFAFTKLLGGDPLPLSDFKGKVVMVVNTASKCGFTPQFKVLEAVNAKYKEQGFVMIGVPSNDFGGQEPLNAEGIAKFCELNYGVTFPMTGKEVVSGDNAHPFYKWASKTLGFGTAPKWNFHKYLIDRNGKLVDYFNSTTAPDAERVTTAIEALLAK
jgi:glutathione peroxidase